MTVLSNLRKDVRGTSAYVGITYGGVAASFLGSIIVTRDLGLPARGAIAVVTVLGLYFTLLLGLGVTLAVRRISAVDSDRLRSLIGTLYRLGLVVTPVAVLAAVPSTLVFAGSLDVMEQVSFGVVLALSGCSVVATGLQQIVAGQGRQVGFAAVRTLPAVGASVVLVVAAVTGRLSLTLVFITLALRSVVELAAAQVLLPLPGAPEPLRGHILGGLQSLPAQAAELSTTRIDQLLLLPLVGSQALGVYAIVTSVVTLPLAFVSSRITSWFGGVARMRSFGFAAAMSPIGRTMLWTIPPVVVVVVACPFVLPVLFGPELEGVGVLSAILGASTLLLAGGLCATYVLLARGQSRSTIVPWVLGTLATVVLLPLAASRWGIEGAGIVSLVSYLVTLAGMVGVIRWTPDSSPATIGVPEPSITGREP